MALILFFDFRSEGLMISHLRKLANVITRSLSMNLFLIKATELATLI